ncbi:hypothetical protein [Muricoccus radiodurans]|uniref:hypothetical protein n=1 Tax=Muricoccus radiodurans TaxID=2231721 RepID=UPI003CF6128E
MRRSRVSGPANIPTSQGLSGFDGASQTGGARGQTVWYVLDSVEHQADVPAGHDMWSHVAVLVGHARRCGARAEDPPSYDTGTRSWTLMLQLEGRRGRAQELAVPVRWRNGG